MKPWFEWETPEAIAEQERADCAANSAEVARVQDTIRADIAAGRDSGFPDLTTEETKCDR